MNLNSLQQLYIENLKDLYSAETQIVKALPTMIKAASCTKLKTAFEQHLEQTREHARRIEQICEGLGESPRGKACKGMQGVLEEGKELLDEKPGPEVLDAGLIGSAQHVEHYEMAGYGTCRTYAEMLGYPDAAKLLQKTLDEESATNKKLTELAISGINSDALKMAN